ncbi:hypothetical protein NIES2104_42080 [Leptolyngbya sp. NIES-2104]|nr:hypothetical protein NIES2104_42080 [Leptolyngbya sp. NIES-2104]
MANLFSRCWTLINEQQNLEWHFGIWGGIGMCLHRHELALSELARNKAIADLGNLALHQ